MENETTTRDAILDAAEALFAKHGFPATTIKRIGGEAGVNPALIYYYFGDKEKLYRELLARLFGRIAGGAGEQLAGATPDTAVRALLGFQSEALLRWPNMPRLLFRELLDHEAEHASEQMTHLAATAFVRFCELIRAGQRAGIFRADFDPRFAAISAISLLPYLHLARPAVGILLGHGTEGPTREEMEAYG
ncbi:MAG TPA: TetR/AcrR family transcriptional regulator, partial [Longimicrobium sp.]|nr:TetR/AcrR family transcriptional regulator [Longimicrobium sp.]